MFGNCLNCHCLLSIWGLCLRIYDSDLFAWISLTALSRLCLRIYDSGLFAWISLTALSRLCLRINDWFLCLD